MNEKREPALLERFEGERPPAAEWFERALAVEPERSTFEVEGANIELLVWGEVGKPGILFLHGNAAHADWWSFIAPYFAKDYRCAAMSWSGMGRSDWRQNYSIPLFAAEAVAAIAEAQLDSSGQAPVIVAHSFGGFPTLYICAEMSDAISGAMLVDSIPPKPGSKPPPMMRDRSEHNRYASLREALMRFRFMPPQQSGMPEIIDYMARHSLKQIAAEDGKPAGWTWRFDPGVWQRFDRSALVEGLISQSKVPLGIIYGEQSALFPEGRIDEELEKIGDCRFVAAIPEARHHILVDQPLALVTAIRAGLTTF